MKRIILFLSVIVFFIVLDLLARGLPPPPKIVAKIKADLPDEAEVVTTLPPLVITVPRPRPPRITPRTILNAAIPPAPDVPEPPALLCGAWRPLATDETQTVRYCEPPPQKFPPSRLPVNPPPSK